MEDNLYACAVCEESFPIAKSLVNHVNDCHVSVQSSVEPKKVVKSMQTFIEQQKENVFKKEETNERKNIKEKSFTLSILVSTVPAYPLQIAPPLCVLDITCKTILFGVTRLIRCT